jgi:hypothetical protein
MFRAFRISGAREAFASTRSARHGQAGVYQDPPELDGGHGFLLRHQEERPHQDRKMVLKKYDPVVRKHVEFREGKIK